MIYCLEKKSSEIFVVTQLIDYSVYSRYFHQIFSIASTDLDLHETMSVDTYMASFACQFRFTNPEILVEKSCNSASGCLAVHVFQRMQALCQG